MNKHHRAAHGTALFQGIPEKQIVIVLQAHAAQDNHIHLRLHGNAGEQLVVWLSGHGEDGQLLTLHQGVEYIDHGDTGADHFIGNGTLGWVHGWAADGDHILGQGGSAIAGHTGAVKNAAQQMIREGYHHRPAQKADRIRGADTLGATEDLECNQVLI